MIDYPTNPQVKCVQDYRSCTNWKQRKAREGPSKCSQPTLYIEGEDYCCVMAVHGPPGFTAPSFVLKACWTSEAPLRLTRGTFIRAFNWLCNVSIYICLIVIIYNFGNLRAEAFFVSLAVALAKAIGNATRNAYHEMFMCGYNLSDIFHYKAYAQWMGACFSKSRWWSTRRAFSVENDKVRPVLDAASLSSISNVMGRLNDDDEIGDIIDLRHRNGLDPELHAEVALILTKCPRSLRSRDNLAQMLSEACENVSAAACFKVLKTYAQTDFELRHRVEEISLHLSRLSASITRKRRGRAENDDIIFGPCFDDRMQTEIAEKSRSQSRSLSSVDGLESFRRILAGDASDGEGKTDDNEIYGRASKRSSQIGIMLRSF